MSVQVNECYIGMFKMLALLLKMIGHRCCQHNMLMHNESMVEGWYIVIATNVHSC